MKLLIFIVFSVLLILINAEHHHRTRKPPGGLFSSIPFLPKPLFKPEKYMKSARVKRTLPTMQRPNFNGLSFNSVYIPMPDPRKKPFNGPTVIPILYGNYTLSPTFQMFSSSIALVIDEKEGARGANENERCYILVDTGLPFFKNTVLGGLAAHGIAPPNITNLILTHTSVDTVGNLNLFPHTNVLIENKIINRQFVYIQKTAPSFDNKRSGLPFRTLCDNTDVFLTPGMTPRDLSLVVKNVSGYGTIAIVGNLIFNEADLKSSENVKEFSLDEDSKKLWEATRKEIVCLADYILPGHGPTFKVTTQMKAAFRCSTKFSHKLDFWNETRFYTFGFIVTATLFFVLLFS